MKDFIEEYLEQTIQKYSDFLFCLKCGSYDFQLCERSGRNPNGVYCLNCGNSLEDYELDLHTLVSIWRSGDFVGFYWSEQEECIQASEYFN
jgi:hypothetical protein